ncbi:MAG TPA: LemA family protein [Planktothrix sp.]|jgi:LemA protein
MTLWAVLIVLGLFGVWMIGSYNRLVVMRQNVRESWSAIDTELRRRYDLIPNLVETVKGYASHEHDTLEDVIKARNSAISTAATPEAQAGAQNMITGALTKLMALSEAYPQLKANENFTSLQKELGDTETRISQARRFYNANVKEFNSMTEQFPTVLVANTFGFHPQTYFGIDNADAYEPVAVKFASGKPEEKPQTIKLNSTIEEKEKA